MKWIKRIAVAVVLLGAIGFLIWKFVINKPIKNVKDQKSDYTVTMQELFKEAAANDSLTKVKYTDKTLTITGIIKEVLLNDSASVVNLGDSATSSIIKCQIDARNNETVKQLQPNTTITIKGRFTGLANQDVDPLFADMGVSLGTNFELKDCNIENKK